MKHLVAKCTGLIGTGTHKLKKYTQVSLYEFIGEGTFSRKIPQELFTSTEQTYKPFLQAFVPHLASGLLGIIPFWERKLSYCVSD